MIIRKNKSKKIRNTIASVFAVVAMGFCSGAIAKCHTEPTNPLQLAAITVWGEARGLSFHDKLMVASVILNRTKHPSYKGSVRKVVKQPGQFSVWHPSNPNYNKMLKAACLPVDSQDYRAYQDSVKATQRVFSSGPVTKALYFSASGGRHTYR